MNTIGARYKNFREFWPFYLSEHSNPQNRRLHFIGATLVFATIIFALFSGTWAYLWAAPFFGYGFAWAGHFIVEKNRPATFKYPLWSLRGDFKLYFLMLIGKIR